MLLRTIMIFPQFNNEYIINAIREKYDPLHNLVGPHITLVFPFQDEMSNIELEKKLEDCLMKTKSFKLLLQGISKQHDVYGNYVFLNVKLGSKEIIDIHKNLYRDIWGREDNQLYVPHMTIGNLASKDEMIKAYADIKNLDICFETFVDKISVEEIGKNDESFIIIEKYLK